MKIHKEGRRILFVTLLILLALNLLMFYFNRGNALVNRLFAGATVIIFLLILQFFRSPFRHMFTHEDLLLAPADGKVVVIEFRG
jgi:phosphatidylserine decarboxylase